MAKYSRYCKGCKLDCEDGLLDLNNPPHKQFSFDEHYIVDFWCDEHQTIVHERAGENPAQNGGIEMMRELELRIGSLRGRRVVEIGEESPILSEEEIVSIERGELEEIL